MYYYKYKCKRIVRQESFKFPKNVGKFNLSNAREWWFCNDFYWISHR